MKKVLTALALFLQFASGFRCFADETQSLPKIPPSSTTASDALKSSPRHGEWVDVPLAGSDVKIRTWVVYPERSDKAPVVLVIHEIFGMSDWVRSVADQLAAEGYIAVAPDMLSGMGPNGGGTDTLGDKVGQNIRKLTQDDEVERLDAVRNYALGLPSAKNESASIGFCWGGGVSFTYATRQPKLNGAIVFYGTPPKKEAIANIACPVLGLYGGDDGRISLTVDDTKKAMSDANKSYDPHIYLGAGHGFLRQQDARNGANLKASQQGWAETITFLKKYLP
jgi:carboxymethylenebutenolidase